jgi:hypothetical protein
MNGRIARAGLVLALNACASPALPQQPLVGPDQTIGLADTARFTLSVPPDLPRVFWSKISGPGVVRFAGEQFNSSFEDGAFAAWLADDGGQVEGGGSISTERAHSGSYSWKAYNDPALSPPDNFSAKLTRWRFDDDSAYYSAWYYWPADYVVNGRGSGATRNYVNIFQYKQRTSPTDPVWIVAVVGIPGTQDQDQFEAHAWDYLEVPTGVAVPKGRWFQITTFLKEGWTDGALMVWLDGRLVFSRDGVSTLGSTANTDPPHVMWGVGNYGTPGIGRSIYVDDAVVVPAGLALAPSATFSAPGTYVLRLTASDAAGTRTVRDDVTVTVR